MCLYAYNLGQSRVVLLLVRKTTWRQICLFHCYDYDTPRTNVQNELQNRRRRTKVKNITVVERFSVSFIVCYRWDCDSSWWFKLISKFCVKIYLLQLLCSSAVWSTRIPSPCDAFAEWSSLWWPPLTWTRVRNEGGGNEAVCLWSAGFNRFTTAHHRSLWLVVIIIQ